MKRFIVLSHCPFCLTVFISFQSASSRDLVKRQLSGVVCYGKLSLYISSNYCHVQIYCIYSLSKDYRHLISSHCDVTGIFLCPQGLCIVWSLPFCLVWPHSNSEPFPRLSPPFSAPVWQQNLNALGDQILYVGMDSSCCYAIMLTEQKRPYINSVLHVSDGEDKPFIFQQYFFSKDDCVLGWND